MKLNKLEIRNFRGFAQASREFGEKEVIEAKNGEGKSSMLDAYKFALGFNVNGFEPTLSPNNTRVGTANKPCTTEVIATIEKDGLTYTLKRISNQQWKVNKDTQAVEFVGNVGKFYFDSESEIGANLYKEKVSSLFGCSFSDLEIITDITYFNSDTAKWKWDSRRKWLFDKLNIDSLVKGLADSYDLITNELKKGKDEVDLAKELNAEKNAIKKAQDDNMTLIEDKQKQLLNYSSIDFVALKEQLNKLQKEYEQLLLKTNKENKNALLAEMQSKLNTLQSEYQKERNLIYIIESKLESEKNDLQKRIDSLIYSINKEQSNITWVKADILEFENKIAEFENKIFDENVKICKECGQELPRYKINVCIIDFEANKSRNIDELRSMVENKRKAIQNATDKANTLTEQLQAVQSQLKALESEIIDKSKIIALEKEIAELSAKIGQLKMAEVKDAVAEKIEALKNEMATINKELGKEIIIADIQSSIEALKKSSLQLTAQEQMRLRKQSQLKDYIFEKVSLVNESVNKWFDGITFNFFKWNGANAENEYESTCTVMLNGVNYQNLSTGEKMYADIKTTQGLMSILNINVPLWVDELQSLTKKFDCEQQFIGLKVVDGKTLDEVLRVDKVYDLSSCVVKGGN